MDYEESPALRVLLVLEVKIWVPRTNSMAAGCCDSTRECCLCWRYANRPRSEEWYYKEDTGTSVAGVCVEDEEVWLD